MLDPGVGGGGSGGGVMHSTPLSRIIAGAVNFVSLRTHEPPFDGDLRSLVRVETPVRLDFERQKVDINDPEAVLRFYKTTYSYILELTAANHQVETLNNYQECLDIVLSHGCRRLYDYGGGIGTLALLARRRGFSEVMLGDLPSPTLGFARERMRVLDENIDTIELDGCHALVPEGVEAIACTEVLEHVFEPEALVKQLVAALPKNGIFIVSESFNYVEEFCTHLPIHQGKGGATFLAFLRRIGLEPFSPNRHLHAQVYRKD